MNPASSRRRAPGSNSALSEEMKENIRKMSNLMVELQDEKVKVASLQTENAKQNLELSKSNISLKERVSQLELVNAQLEKFNKERVGILMQLQQEMSNYVTIQEKFQEQEQSMQMIMRELELEREDLLNELAVKDIINSDSIDDLNEEVDGLNEQLKEKSETTTCSICLTPWDSEGAHRLVSLRCGHLFGNKCIRLCLRQSRQCPICMKRAHHADVRRIYGSISFPQ
ncbi:E3 ubiquitin-protein ligase RNF8-like [Drosophila eugracilis]|uniref:E3 ubiquitin-protein ligase RNF8-like n=1 Tax=Drosophila eugracilis TaxID=29029 RepID=UPI0007E72B25|nr:E3 ubiquitin-protein ligase RNF8-like [Drosophila eugracilis]